MQRGTLTGWNDDRGFGFIKADNSSQEVFLHISALPQGTRRPQDGDIILYEVLREQNGKFKARSAQIEGVKVNPSLTGKAVRSSTQSIAV